MVETIYPKNDEHWHSLRAKDVTSTEIAALFNLSPYMTKFELWHRHRDLSIVDIAQNERMIWGTRLQSAIAAGIAADNGWSCRPKPEYMRDPDLRIGASFDFEVSTPMGRGLLEVKNIDSMAFRDGWLDSDSGVEAPPHIELQVQHQMAVSGFDFAYIGALVGGNRVVLIHREATPSIINRIHAVVAEHWASVEANEPPLPDFARDSEFISKLYGYAEKDRLFDARGDKTIAALAADYRAANEEIKILDGRKSEIKARLLEVMGPAEKLLGDGFSISASMTEPTRVEAFERKGFRNFRCNFKKGDK